VPASIDERENLVTAEVGRRAHALHESVLAVNGMVSGCIIYLGAYVLNLVKIG